jgi:ABC-type polar amino acid transport system ATPase subunit
LIGKKNEKVFQTSHIGDMIRGALTAIPHRQIGAAKDIGSSGSGKTTLLRCVNLLKEFHRGHVPIDGEEIEYPEKMNPRSSFQTQFFSPHRTVAGKITGSFHARLPATGTRPCHYVLLHTSRRDCRLDHNVRV